jgi:uncharacterized protein (TIGR02301 family)
MKRFAELSVVTIALIAPAFALSSARDGALISLSRIFGEMHHIRRMCEPDREADAWRNRMKRLIDLEQPSFELRESMVGAFNDGYLSAQTRHPFCDGAAEDYAAARAAAGEAIVSNLTATIYAEQRRSEEDDIEVIRGNEPQ